MKRGSFLVITNMQKLGATQGENALTTYHVSIKTRRSSINQCHHVLVLLCVGCRDDDSHTKEGDDR